MSTTVTTIQKAGAPTQTLVEEVARMWENDISSELDESTKTHFEPLFAALISRVQGKVESEQYRSTTTGTGQNSR